MGMERRLAAIFSTDVQGYSRLMGEDEVATIRTIIAYRELMASLIQQHRGRVVDSPGDNLLAEFASVVEAVQCAVAIQQELKVRNAELSPQRRMAFRIGINLGDVVVEGERIYGDGVNIAARLGGLAEAGGICIAGTVYDQIATRLTLGYEYLGEQAVKNIARPGSSEEEEHMVSQGRTQHAHRPPPPRACQAAGRPSRQKASSEVLDGHPPLSTIGRLCSTTASRKSEANGCAWRLGAGKAGCLRVLNNSQASHRKLGSA